MSNFLDLRGKTALISSLRRISRPHKVAQPLRNSRVNVWVRSTSS